MPGLPNGAANCSAPCGPIRPKFHVVNGLGYGYGPCKFSWAGSRYVGRVAKKPVKIDVFAVFSFGWRCD